MQPTASHAGKTMPAPPRASSVALWIFLASAMICTFAYLAVTVAGRRRALNVTRCRSIGCRMRAARINAGESADA